MLSGVELCYGKMGIYLDNLGGGRVNLWRNQCGNFNYFQGELTKRAQKIIYCGKNALDLDVQWAACQIQGCFYV